MHRWKLSAFAAAAVACAGLHGGDAFALALGRITVQSALGEPLRAEIDLPLISPAEADALRAAPASPEVFRAQGVEYTQVMNGLKIELQRRPDGSAMLRLSSDRPVHEPFLDLVLDANWGAGHIVRSYTMLFDPPVQQRAAPAGAALAQLTDAATPQPVAPPAESNPAPVPALPAPAPGAARAPAPEPAPAPANGVSVKPGDTAGRIAAAHKPEGVSLDQMLVALLRSNPGAFVQGNVNRLRAGVLLHIPDQAAAQGSSAEQAHTLLAAQARDFNEYRRKLAGSAGATEIAGAQRSAAGAVRSASVQDGKSASAAPDKLTLSKGALKGQKAAEEQLAQDKQKSQNAARMAELSKNISELNQLGGSSAAPAPAPAAPPGSSGAAAHSSPGAVTVPSAVVPPTPTAPPAPPAPEAPAATVSAAPADAAGAISAVPAPGDQAATAPPPAAPPPPPAAAKPAAAPLPAPEEPGLFATLMQEPLLPIGGAALLAGLLGLGAFRLLRRKRQGAGANAEDSTLQKKGHKGPDSFFGASGGQRVDTASGSPQQAQAPGGDQRADAVSSGQRVDSVSDQAASGATSSIMAYSPSQLDAGGDVDPVAEADVYLAYGRDLQAEEILKEAVRHNPARVSVHTKLGEIYAKRQDRKALEAVAAEVFKLTQGEGPDWTRIAEMGRELDSANPLYQPGGRPGGAGAAAAGAGDSVLGDSRLGHSVLPPLNIPSQLGTAASGRAQTPAQSMLPDLNLDLDLDLPDSTLSRPAGALPSALPAASGFGAAAAPQPRAAQTVQPVQPTAQAAQTTLRATLDFPAVPAASPAIGPITPEPATDERRGPNTAPSPLTTFSSLASLDFSPPDGAAAPTVSMGLAPTTSMGLAPTVPMGMAPTSPMTLGAAPAADGAATELSTLSLDLPGTAPRSPDAGADDGLAGAQDDPLATKLALAEEFSAIGDADGARTLIEEVIAEAGGVLKTRAQRMLAQLG